MLLQGVPFAEPFHTALELHRFRVARTNTEESVFFGKYTNFCVAFRAVDSGNSNTRNCKPLEILQAADKETMKQVATQHTSLVVIP